MLGHPLLGRARVVGLSRWKTKIEKLFYAKTAHPIH